MGNSQGAQTDSTGTLNQGETSASGVQAARPDFHREGGGSIPTLALQHLYWKARDLWVKPIPAKAGRRLCEAHHYLHSYPGGAFLNLGVFAAHRLLGVLVLGAGPTNLHRLFKCARNNEVACLARLWLDDRLGRNSESRVLGVVLRLLRKEQSTLKALVAYSDPSVGHTGMIYRAAGFLYLGESMAMPLYRLPDGSVHHSRSLAHSYGTYSRKHFASFGVDVDLVQQSPRHTYVVLIDPNWRERLTRPVIPYPKQGAK